TLPAGQSARPKKFPLFLAAFAVDTSLMVRLAGSHHQETISMVSHSSNLLVEPARPILTSSTSSQEREHLRRELLRRIIDRETKRQAMRGSPQ
ncbi:MAG: hypothetical protein WCJ18_04185, partial [Planctomycetota bacterium]